MSKQAIIFDIQRFSIHDGPGIRTTIFFKGCPLRCRWCQNPESHKPEKEIAFYKERCMGCFACKEVCPNDAINESENGRIDYPRCNDCGICVSECPNNALRMVGMEWDAASLLVEIVKDKDFFVDSGGGITLSGGEPFLQIGFLKEFFPLVKNEQIHVNMETCGMFRWPEIEAILPYLDLIYFDLKMIDSEKHKTYTGRDNRVIIENFVQMVKTSPHLQPRMPVIPTINDDPENILNTARLLNQNNIKSIHLLTYHNLGEAKLGRINTRLTPLDIPKDAGRPMADIKALFLKEGIEASSQ